MSTAVLIQFHILWTSHIFCFRQSQIIEFLMRVRHSWIRIPGRILENKYIVNGKSIRINEKNKKCEVTAEASYFLTFTALSWQLCRMLQYVLPFYHSWFCSRTPYRVNTLKFFGDGMKMPVKMITSDIFLII